MKEQLGRLFKLQEIDEQIDEHEKKVAQLPAQVQKIAANLVGIRREIDEGKEELSRIELESRQKEQELASEQDKIRRSEKKLLNIKNQKEYNALSREVKLGKRVESQLEDAILEFMTKSEILTKRVARKQEQCAEFEGELDAKKAEAEEATTAAEKALSTLQLEKAGVVERIDRKFAAKYLSIKKVRQTAVAEMNDGICDKCNIAVPPQMAITVLKQEEILYCPNCQRMLYVKPENIPEPNKIEW